MKIDYSKNGMTIKLDKIPRLIYINENGHDNTGGQAYIDGQRIKNLQSVKIKAKCADSEAPFLQFDVNYYDTNAHQSAGIAQGRSLTAEALCDLSIPIKVTDMEVFKNTIDILKMVGFDEKVPLEVRKQVLNKINAIMEDDK